MVILRRHLDCKDAKDFSQRFITVRDELGKVRTQGAKCRSRRGFGFPLHVSRRISMNSEKEFPTKRISGG